MSASNTSGDNNIDLNVVNIEISEALAGAAQQHEHIRQAVQTYLVLLGCYFAFFGFFLKEGVSCQSACVLILFSVVVFGGGWWLLSYLGSRIRNVLLFYKHVSSMRGLRLGHLLCKSDNISLNYLLPSSPEQVRVPSGVWHAPFMFFYINLILFMGGITFALYHIAPSYALESAALLLVLLSVVYPNSCRTYDKKIVAAMEATTFKHIDKIEQAYDKVRERRMPRRRRKLIYYISMLLALLLFVLSINSAETIIYDIFLVAYALSFAVIAIALAHSGKSKMRTYISTNTVKGLNTDANDDQTVVP